MGTSKDDAETFDHFEYRVGPGERSAFANGRASRDVEVATLSAQLADAQRELEEWKKGNRAHVAAENVANERRKEAERQLAEAQEARDLNAAALECYSAEQARLRKELAEAQGVIERQRTVTDEMIAALLRAAKAVEDWWITQGMKHFGGAPYAIFATRAAIAKAEGSEKPEQRT